jgi:gamma-glutamyltranspeptidase/glutathione hydrolase
MRARRLSVPALLLLLAACRAAQPPVTAPVPGPDIRPQPPAVAPEGGAWWPAAWRYAERAKRAEGARGMVAAGNVLASEVGVAVMRRGGNAVDAAVAVGFAMAVVDPEAGNIGGGGFMLVRLASGETALLDYRERAPGAATRDMFVGPDGRATDASQVGHLAPGVPGSVAGLVEAHRRFGSLPLASLVEPAIRLARDGFVLDSIRAARLGADSAKLARFPASAAIFLPGGRVPRRGERLVQPDLARTLEAIRDRGADGFYRGWVADSIVAEMQRGGGLISHADLAAYTPVWREPTRVTYRRHTILGAPPVSSGGLTTGLMLNVLARGPMPAFGSAEQLHLYAETFRRAFTLRNRHLEDPAFGPVPAAWFLSPALADSLRTTIDTGRATPTLAAAPTPGTGSTTHYSIVDPEGNAVSTTTTINDLYGSGVTVRGAGFLLNDEMDDFSTAPGRPNSWGVVGGEVNAPAPGKRPLSSMTPTILVDPEGRTLALVGSRGGATIITQVLQVLVNLIDYRMGLVEAVAAPRVHHQALPDRLRMDRDGFRPETVERLRAMGHEVIDQTPGGDVEAIMRRPGGGWIGVSDPRSGGAPAGF